MDMVSGQWEPLWTGVRDAWLKAPGIGAAGLGAELPTGLFPETFPALLMAIELAVRIEREQISSLH